MMVNLIVGLQLPWKPRGLETLDRKEWHRSDRGGHRLVRVLLERGMGHHACSRTAQGDQIQLLSRVLSRHHFQHNVATQNIVLHNQFDYSLCGHFLLVYSSVLSTIGQWRESESQSS